MISVYNDADKPIKCSIMIGLIKRKGFNKQTKKVHYFPRWTSLGTVTKKVLAKIMARGSTFSVGEIEGILTDFAQYICDALLDGQTVVVDGLGKFTLSVSGKAQESPGDVTAEGVDIKVLFTPDKDLKLRLVSESEFQFVAKSKEK